MADQQSRGGKKAGEGKQAPPQQHQGVEAPVDKKQPGHAQDDKAREKYLKETEGRR